MASYPPPGYPPPGFDPRAQRRMAREQGRMQRAAIKAQRDQIRYQMLSTRRSSVLGPILLVSLGVIFLLLQTGRLPHQRFFDFYGRYWPLLLVGAGVILLAEWAFDQYALRDPQAPRYRRSIGGGVFTLLLLFGVAGFVFDQARLHVNGSNWFYGWRFNPDEFDQFLGDKHESDQTLDQAFPAGGTLTVVNPHGDVTLTGGAPDDRIHISIHKQVYSRSDSDADAKAQQLNPSLVANGSALSLTLPSLDGTRADLVITLPASALATITANHGDIHVSEVKGAVAATANHGDIELSGISGPVNAHINSSGASLSAHSLAQALNVEGRAQDVTLADIAGPVSISGEFFGTTHLQHIAGTIRFHTSRTDFQLARLDGEAEISPHSDLSADQALGPVILTTSNRNITLDRVAGDISVTNRNGSIDLTATSIAGSQALGNITLQDRNGSIKATMPDHSGFVLQANTTNGNIENDFGLSSSGSDHANSITGTVASGGAMVHLSTTNADISLHKAQIDPLHLTPLPPGPLTATPSAAPPAKTRK